MATLPVFHLSLPVRSLDEAIAFYVEQLGATVGRRTASFVDVFVFGAQLTLQNDPTGVSYPMPRTRHFGATISGPDWEAAAARFKDAPSVVEAPHASYSGEAIEQRKMMIADPSGNLIELKTYRHPERVLIGLATACGRVEA